MLQEQRGTSIPQTLASVVTVHLTETDFISAKDPVTGPFINLFRFKMQFLPKTLTSLLTTITLSKVCGSHV